jgi:hypothetical protein
MATTSAFTVRIAPPFGPVVGHVPARAGLIRTVTRTAATAQNDNLLICVPPLPVPILFLLSINRLSFVQLLKNPFPIRLGYYQHFFAVSSLILYISIAYPAEWSFRI